MAAPVGGPDQRSRQGQPPPPRSGTAPATPPAPALTSCSPAGTDHAPRVDVGSGAAGLDAGGHVEVRGLAVGRRRESADRGAYVLAYAGGRRVGGEVHPDPHVGVRWRAGEHHPGAAYPGVAGQVARQRVGENVGGQAGSGPAGVRGGSGCRAACRPGPAAPGPAGVARPARTALRRRPRPGCSTARPLRHRSTSSALSSTAAGSAPGKRAEAGRQRRRAARDQQQRDDGPQQSVSGVAHAGRRRGSSRTRSGRGGVR